MARTGITTIDNGDWQKWAALASALIAVGVFPKAWQKTIGTLTSLAWLANRL